MIPEDFLPELLECIFSKLPHKIMLQCRSVCKYWHKILIDHRFAQKLLKNPNCNLKLIFRFDPEIFLLDLDASFRKVMNINLPWEINTGGNDYIWSSCNGLLCITTRSNGYLYLWNPYTRDIKRIPNSRILAMTSDFNCYSTFSFGYNEDANDYEVVCILSFTNNGRHSEVQIYSLAKKSWKRIQNIPYKICNRNQKGKFVKEKIHWVATRLNESREKLIIAYDMKDEKFVEVSLPNYANEHVFGISVAALDGNPIDGELSLAVIVHYYKDMKSKKVCTQAWKLDEKSSWTELFNLEKLFEPICFVKGTAELLLIGGPYIFLYEMNTKVLRILAIENLPESIYDTTTYKESITSLS